MIGAVMGVATVWWGISSGLLSVIGLGGVMLSMTVLALPQLVTLRRAASSANPDDTVQYGIAGPHVYDKIDWHTAAAMDAGFDDYEQADMQAGVPASFFYGWLLSRGLFRGDYARPGSDMFDDYQARRVTALELYQESDGCLIERDLTDEGNAFARSYYRADGESPSYDADLTTTLAVGLPSEYHVPYTWENQERMDTIIDQRYAQWRTENSCSTPADPSAEGQRGIELNDDEHMCLRAGVREADAVAESEAELLSMCDLDCNSADTLIHKSRSNLPLTNLEILAMSNATRFALEHLPDWQFHTRVGRTKSEVLDILDGISGKLNQSE